MTKSYMRYSFLYRLPAIAACIFHFNLVYSQTPNPLPKTADSQGEQEIPLFAQVLELCKGKIYIYLDFKNADPAAAWREIVKRDTVISMNIRRR
jgi:hypothetical protein